jgi:AraC family transcriptional regulator, transcriptional activator of pobA
MGEKKPNNRFISTPIEPELSTPATPAKIGFMVIHPGDQPPEEMPGQFTFFTMLHVIKGSGSLELGGQEYPLKAGHFYFSLPGQVIHHMQFADLKAVMIFAPAAFLSKCHPNLMQMRFLQYAHHNQHIALNERQSRELFRLETHIMHEINAALPLKDETMQSMFRLHLLTLERNYRLSEDFVEREDNKVVREFYAALNFNHDYSVSLGEFADLLNTSPTHLNSVVRTHTDKSARQHVHDKMVELAKAYLEHTSYNIEEISYLLGFHFPQYFDRVFKKDSGLTPSDFRKLKTSA